MKSAGVLLILIAACSNGVSDDEYPLTPGGGGGGGGGTGGGGSGSNLVDAGIDSSGATTISGRVCLITDLRVPGTCPARAAGVTVRLGGLTATTNATGDFTIQRQPGADTWIASGGPVADPIFTTIMPLVDGHDIPVLTAARYGELSTGNGVLLQDDEGAVVMRLVRGVDALGLAKVTVAPQSPSATYYDGTSSEMWDTDETGTRGVVWLPGLPVVSEVVTVKPAVGMNVIKTFPVTAQAITFATIQVP